MSPSTPFSASTPVAEKEEWERVPWHDVWEWETVGRALLSVDQHDENGGSPTNSTVMNVEEALKRVEVWKYRIPHLPHSVESTAALVAVLWRHKQQQSSLRVIAEQTPAKCAVMLMDSTVDAHSMEAPTDDTLRLAYAAAIVRTINGLVDVYQQSRAVATSVANLATTRLGLPGWLVDVRHAATHNQLPTLPVLHLAAVTLLQYLRASYWEAALTQFHSRKQDDFYKRLRTYEQRAQQQYQFHAPPKQSKAINTTTSTTTHTLTDEYIPIPVEKEKVARPTMTDEHDNSHLTSTRLGTNHNMFALLMEPSKRKTSKRNEKTTKDNKKTKKQQRSPKDAVSTKATSRPPSLQALALAVTESRPRFLLWHCFVTHLVWGHSIDEKDSVSTITGGALLVDAEDNTPSGSPQSPYLVYDTLLRTVARAVPGLLEVLIIHLTDFVLLPVSHQWHPGYGVNTCTSVSKKRAVAVAWVRYLLSQTFNLSVLGTEGKTTNDLHEEMSVNFDAFMHSPQCQLATQASLPFNLPLRALTERCHAVVQDTPATMNEDDLCHVRELRDSFLEVGGWTVTPSLYETRTTSDAFEKDPIVDLKSSEVVGQPMSLEEMEAVLHRGGLEGSLSVKDRKDVHGEENGAPQVKEEASTGSYTVAPWTLCTRWEICPIGTLPGYPS